MCIIETTEKNITPIYHQMYDECVNNHKHWSAYYQRGLLHFHEGNYINALDDIESLFESYKATDPNDSLPLTTYFNKGQIESELGLYNEAIVSLSHVIEKDPSHKEAYFERALAHFELGDFDMASSDFLSSGFSKQNSGVTNKIDFACGFIKGVGEGVNVGSIEFIPGILSSLQGLGHCIWAIGTDPVGVSSAFVDAIYDCVSYIQANSLTDTSVETAMLLVPELRELVAEWNTYEDKTKGEKIGYIIGKHGIDIFLTCGTIKGVQVLTRLKRANGILTLEQLSSTSSQTNTIKTAVETWNSRHLSAMERFKIAEGSLKEFQGQNISEIQARKILHQAGFKTFKRPEGIPNNFRIQISDRGGGMVYYHPKHNHTSIRVMPGKPHSINPFQRNPYVICKIDGKTIDKYGNFIPKEATEAHIPLNEFVFREL